MTLLYTVSCTRGDKAWRCVQFFFFFFLGYIQNLCRHTLQWAVHLQQSHRYLNEGEERRGKLSSQFTTWILSYFGGHPGDASRCFQTKNKSEISHCCITYKANRETQVDATHRMIICITGISY